MSIEQVAVRLQTLKVDTHRQLSEHFKTKLQLEEQLEDNEVKLHFCRGVIAACDEFEDIIADVQQERDVPSLLNRELGVSVQEGFAMEQGAHKMIAPDEDVDKIIEGMGNQGEGE